MQARPRKRRIGRRPKLDLKTQEIIPSEFEECKAFWQYCQRYLRLGLSVFHVPNEGIRESWYTKALINIGMTPGVLDYFFLKRTEKYGGLIIDMKRRNMRGKKTDEDQDLFIENAIKEGYYASYAYGCEDAIRIYTEYVNNRL